MRPGARLAALLPELDSGCEEQKALPVLARNGGWY